MIISDSDSAFLAKYDNAGNVIWVKSSSIGLWEGYCLARDRNNNIYLSLGSNYKKSNIIFCNETLNINAPKDPSVFLKLDTAGNALFGSIIRTGGDDENCITCSQDGKYTYVGGDIHDTIAFGSDFLNNYVTMEPPFIARWGVSKKMDNVFEISLPQSNTSLFPNPNKGQFTIQSSIESGKLSVEIYNMLGEKVYSQFNIRNPTFNIDVSSQPNGIYLYRVLTTDKSLVGEGKLIIQK